MKGIEKRVASGFICLLALLFASGMISLFELNTMSDDTEMILKASHDNMETARDILRLADQHSFVVMHATVFGERDYRDDCDSIEARLNRRIELAIKNRNGHISMDSVLVRFQEMKKATDLFMEDRYIENLSVDNDISSNFQAENYRTEGDIWYGTVYEPAHSNLVVEVWKFMKRTYSSLTPRAAQLQKNAYRSVAPVFIALLVIIAITLVFYYMIHIYCLKPIVKITERLASFLNFGVKYDVKCEKIDEISQLDDQIRNLISRTPSANKGEVKE